MFDLKLTIGPFDIPGLANTREGKPLARSVVGQLPFLKTESVPLRDLALTRFNGVRVGHVDESQQARRTHEPDGVVDDADRVCV